jgi:hypothetical protein
MIAACPFCGCRDIFATQTVDDHPVLYCGDCLATGPPDVSRNNVVFYTDANFAVALRLWNGRLGLLDRLFGRRGRIANRGTVL